ncbi:hypothetical protein [Methylophilus sp. Leaf414]|uniref:hypothetical protein n=1 Tax=Methylophilus sp. Leaf414 TaxID=1736371 RepID=UPI0006FC9DD3|nr:hypothetical protein [Methylophilus sp. Leaf414]KQT37673.1 hypothetical protein ASG24_01370 [Methylophilus sp. Leaf414]
MTSLLTIGIPSTIADANILANSVGEFDYPEWSIAETYGLGDYVMISEVDIHKVYRSVLAGNVGHNPLEEADINNPVYWSFVGATNGYKMFDDYINTQTLADGLISFTLGGMGQVNTFPLFGLTGEALLFEISDEDGTPISSQTVDLISYSSFGSFYDWLFTPFLSTSFVVFENIPPYYNAKFKVTITGAGQVGIGAVVPCYGYQFNSVTRESSIDQKDYSLKDELTPGIFLFEKGPTVIVGEFEFYFEESKFDLLNNLVRQRAGLPTLVIGNSSYETMTLYGVIQGAPNNLPSAVEGLCRLKIESLF